MKLLTLDVGNTTVDACEFVEDTLNYLGRFPHGEFNLWKGDYDSVVAVSVKPSFERNLYEHFSGKLRMIELEDIPIANEYRSPKTLGTDRVLFAYGVRELYTDSALLVMVGTAFVVDLLYKGVFKGGFITAGPRLKLKSLSNKAEGIPELEPEPINTFVGKSTKECILGGVFYECSSFIEKTAERWSEKLKEELPVYITGGDGWLFEEFGTYDPLILHKAMRRIIINP